MYKYLYFFIDRKSRYKSHNLLRTRCPLLSDGPPKRWSQRWGEHKTSGELHDGLVPISCPGNNESSHLTSQIPITHKNTHNLTKTSEPEVHRALSSLPTTHKISEMQPPLCNHYCNSKIVFFFFYCHWQGICSSLSHSSGRSRNMIWNNNS